MIRLRNLVKRQRYADQTSSPLVLSVAGHDPSGGAGIIADVSTFTAFGCSSAAVITSITSQNVEAVYRVEHVSPETIRSQLLAVVEKDHVAGLKTGMLPTRECVREVTRCLREMQLPAPVIDPVIRSTSGYALVEADAVSELLNSLLPLARLITPNIPEAEQITGLPIANIDDMKLAALAIRKLGARAVLIKGGHLEGNKALGSPHMREAIDLLNDDDEVTVFRGEWFETTVRGTGCRLSAAIAASLSKGESLPDAVNQAKQFVAAILRKGI